MNLSRPTAAVMLACAALFSSGAGAADPTTDARTLVPVDPATRQAVLIEMRDFLKAVQQVMGFALDGRLQDAAQAARHVGLSHFATAGNASDPAIAVYRIGNAAPAQFRQLAAQTHAGFDRVAELAANGAQSTAVLRELNVNMGRCLTCHAAYKFPAIEPEAGTSLPRTVMNPPHAGSK